jgi:hypothetical protein
VGSVTSYEIAATFLSKSPFRRRLERVDVVFAEVVILVEDRVFRVRQRPGEEFCVDLPFGVEADEARGGQREIRDIGELVRPGYNTDRRHAARDQVFCHRRVAGCSELAEHEGDLVALDELAGMFDSLRGAVGIVIRDVVDLAPVDATAIVNGLDIGKDAPANQADRRGWPAEGKNSAYLDFRCGDTGRVSAVG